jgi:hypothetical protein
VAGAARAVPWPRFCAGVCATYGTCTGAAVAAGVAGYHNELSEVLKIVVPEPGSILGVRVELEERVEQGVDPWPGSETPEVQFSPQTHRASSEKCRHYFRVSQLPSFR